MLRDIGGLLLNNTRKNDFAARYGGEELAIIFPYRSFDYAIALAERLREAIRQAPFANATRRW